MCIVYIYILSRALCTATTETLPSPLEGIKILDMTRILAGPFATMIMADLGAEVVKVEAPGTGDDTRTWGPPFLGQGEHRESCYFLSVNRNKKSICVNMKTNEGRRILQKLASQSDVLIENYVPGKYASKSHICPHNPFR